MPQYAVLIWEAVPAAELPQEVMDGARRAPRPRSPRPAGGSSPASALQDAVDRDPIRGELLTDGPFIETKEDLAGVYVLEARDLDHALALAKLTPIVEGGVEVRPLLGFEVIG